MIHDCNSGNAALDFEDVLVIGDYEDFSTDGVVQVPDSVTYVAGVTNELQGTLGGILGSKDFKRTDRGLNSGLYRQRRRKEFIDIKSLKGIAGVIGEIRQLVDNCTKAEIKMGQLIELSKIGIIVKQLAEIVHKHVKDERILELIADEFDRVIIPATFASTPQPENTTPIRKVPRLPSEVRD